MVAESKTLPCTENEPVAGLLVMVGLSPRARARRSAGDRGSWFGSVSIGSTPAPGESWVERLFVLDENLVLLVIETLLHEGK